MGISVNNALPAGSIQQFAGASAPAGWLECGGQAVSRSTYAALFLAIGTAFGAGDGSTTFNVPDMRGRVGVGRDNMGGTAANRVTAGNSGLSGTTLGAAGGGEVVTLTAAQMPSHGGHVTGVSTALRQGGSLDSSVSSVSTGSQGGGGAHSVLQPSLIINWIIKT